MNEETKDKMSSLWKTFLLILVGSYIVWFLGGGPERWDQKFDKIVKEKKGAPIFIDDPFENNFQENKLK